MNQTQLPIRIVELIRLLVKWVRLQQRQPIPMIQILVWSHQIHLQVKPKMLLTELLKLVHVRMWSKHQLSLQPIMKLTQSLLEIPKWIKLLVKMVQLQSQRLIQLTLKLES